MSGEKCNNWLDRVSSWVRIFFMVIVATTAALVFVWNSQGAQDKRMGEQDVAIARLEEKFKAIDDKLKVIHDIVKHQAAKED